MPITEKGHVPARPHRKGFLSPRSPKPARSKHSTARSRQSDFGFTLIELLVVISLISLMSSILLVSLVKARSRGRDAKRQSEMAAIAQALTMYQIDNGKFPCHEITTSQDDDFLQVLVDKGYLSDIPRDPLNNEYVYEYQSFKTTASGPCGQIAYLGSYFENVNACPSGGIADPYHFSNPYAIVHCHTFVPNPLPKPPCSNPYWLENVSWPLACQRLMDTSGENSY